MTQITKIRSFVLRNRTIKFEMNDQNDITIITPTSQTDRTMMLAHFIKQGFPIYIVRYINEKGEVINCSKGQDHVLNEINIQHHKGLINSESLLYIDSRRVVEQYKTIEDWKKHRIENDVMPNIKEILSNPKYYEVVSHKSPRTGETTYAIKPKFKISLN
jgi:hypothetical protein